MREYLYSDGHRRHIRDPEFMPPPGDKGYSARALCDQHHDTETRMKELMRWWQTGPVSERAIARKKSEPVCKRCEHAEATR